MDAASNAVSRFFTPKDPAPEDETVTNNTFSSDVDAPRTTSSPGDDVDTTVSSEVAPAVSHEHIKNQHETREQTFIEKGKYHDHYHSTIQPLKDAEVLPEKHDHVQETEHRSFDQDDNTAKAKAEADRAGFESTSEKKEVEVKTKEPTLGEEHVHHHLHETVQPVIEKGKFDWGRKIVGSFCSYDTNRGH
jgi:hypothetical protein